MGNRPFRRGEDHHWWPESLSKFWVDDEGGTSRLSAQGEIARLTPSGAANISGGHNIEFVGEGISILETFEDLFDRPDSSFPGLVKWLESLADAHLEMERRPLCVAHSSDEQRLDLLYECMLSLVVRSPMFRSRIHRGIERFNRWSTKKQYKQLVAANLKQSYSEFLQHRASRGKFMVLTPTGGEFIFGDGCYNTIYPNSQLHPPIRMLVALTPVLAVLYELPMACLVEPRIVTRIANERVIGVVNDAVQVYSRDYVFYRGIRPPIRDFFQQREHLVFSGNDPISDLVAEIPGIEFDMPW